MSQFSKSSHPSKILLSPSQAKIGTKSKKKKFQRHMKTFQLTQLSHPTEVNEEECENKEQASKFNEKMGEDS